MSEPDPVVLQLLREELVAWSRRGYERGLVAGVSGNNSLRVPGTDLILIKATGGCQGDMDLTDTVLMSLDGEVLDPGRRPSKEWRWHAALYRARPDTGAVVHLHPPHVVAFAVADEPLPLVHTAARAHLRKVGYVELLPAGSPELADAVARAYSDPEVRAVVMREHGSITIGPDLRTAYFRTEYLEDCAKVATLAAAIRGTAPSKIQLADDADPLAEVR
jgi:ribulose-5-phosphate 4-epimerase/fuculose-1-phosphate aldolase